MWITFNFICWLLLLVTSITGLNQRAPKKLVKHLILSRIFYICLIISQVMLTFYYFKARTIILIISDLFCLGSAALVEINFRKKQMGDLKQPQIDLVFAVLIVYIIFQTWSILPTSVY